MTFKRYHSIIIGSVGFPVIYEGTSLLDVVQLCIDYTEDESTIHHMQVLDVMHCNLLLLSTPKTKFISEIARKILEPQVLDLWWSREIKEVSC